MLKEKADNLKIKHLKHVLKPLKRGFRLKEENYIDIGFDCEWQGYPREDGSDFSNERTLLTVQFSLGRGQSRMYRIMRKGGLASRELLGYVLKFLDELGVEPKKDIYLITYFALAELSMISDFYEKYDTPEGFKIAPQINEYHKCAFWDKHFYDVFAPKVTLHIRDLMGQMPHGLESVGKSFGFEKIKLELDGASEQYWKEHMAELLDKHPDFYEVYALRDAEIPVIAWRSIVEIYKPLNLDPHRKITCTALAIGAFLRQMTVLPCPVTEEKTLGHRWMKAGYWKDYVKKQVVFNGDFNARLMAIYSYWGGHNEAFAVGYFPPLTNITQWDVKSLYIIAGVLQPLSLENTVYKQLTLEDVEGGAEGFCHVDFEFPEGTVYPTLPILVSYYEQLMFPLRGNSYCTLSELRQALSLGVKLANFSGYGFYATEYEKNNELKAFLADMLKNKNEMEDKGLRNTADYAVEKAKMVGLIGKFAQMNSGSTAGDISRLLRDSGLTSPEFRMYARKKAIQAMYSQSEVGGSWSIEWASLILGKARSVAGWMINQGQCIAISTDGGFWLGNPHFEESLVSKEMSKFHSGIRREDLKKPIDEFWIGRNRAYVAWSKGEPVYAAQGPIAVSGHNREEKKLNFVKMVRDSINAKATLYAEQDRTRLTGLKDFLQNGIPLCSVERKKLKCNWLYDAKRMVDREINIFTENTWTRPYGTVEEAYKVEYGSAEVGRPRGSTLLTNAEETEIKAAPKLVTHKQLAEQFGTSISTIRRLRHKD